MAEARMTDEEIVKRFLQAKDKKKQVKVLAELNGSDQGEIQNIILTHLSKRTPVESVMDIIFKRVSDIEDLVADLEREHRELTETLKVLSKLKGADDGHQTTLG